LKTILITGGAGFIGSNLCHRLIEENMIICLDNLSSGDITNISDLLNHPNFTFIERDVKMPFDIPCNQIYHLAAHASPKFYLQDPIETSLTIAWGSLNALNNALKYKATILLASTSEIYGEPLIHPQPESYFGNVNTVGPRSCYDQSKRWMETLGNDYHQKYQLDVKIARIFNTYGPRMSPDDGRVISEMLVRGIKKEHVFIYGDGQQTRSFCYIDDLMDQMTAMMNRKGAGPLNMGNDREYTILQLAEKVSNILGYSLKLKFKDALVNDPIRRQPDLTQLKSMGYKASIEIDEGLTKTLNYFKNVLKETENFNYKPDTQTALLIKQSI
jgi:UDP-glucuronate decarboxylase